MLNSVGRGLGRPSINNVCTMGKFISNNLPMMASMSSESTPRYSYETLAVTKTSDYVFHVELNRPDKLNSMNGQLWSEIGLCFSTLGQDADCRSIVLSGRGRLFTAGIDLAHLMEMSSIVMSDEDYARKAKTMRTLIKSYQDSFTELEKCPKPVIAAVHNACIGGGIDLVTAADIRYCSKDAYFSVKEVDVGLAADVGTLQRLPKIMGSQSLVRELAFSARNFYSDEALSSGFVSRVFTDKDTLVNGALELAKLIAEKSPVAVQATKEVLIHSRDHTVQEGLDYIANLNQGLLQSEDPKLAAMAAMQKQKPTYAKL